MFFVEHDHVVRTLAPRRTDQALNKAVLPGRAEGRRPIPNVHRSEAERRYGKDAHSEPLDRAGIRSLRPTPSIRSNLVFGRDSMRNNAAGSLDWARDRRILSQGAMSSRRVAIAPRYLIRRPGRDLR